MYKLVGMLGCATVAPGFAQGKFPQFSMGKIRNGIAILQQKLQE